MSNRITAYFKGRIGVAESVYQNDYGIVMAFDSIDLPAHFDCYFSRLNQEEALPGLGADNMVAIPNSILANPGNVTIHIPLHTGENDSEVEYVIYFKVIGRARPIDDGTPTQMTAIEQALALLQNPITNIEQIVNEALDFTGETFEEMQEDLDEWKGDTEESLDTWKDGVEDGLDTWKDGVDADVATCLHAVGSPLVASTVAGMTDNTKIYVYTGSETGYTAGNWYYWNGSAWTSGGVYNSTALNTDTTLLVSGAAADAKVTGDEITDLKDDITDVKSAINVASKASLIGHEATLLGCATWIQTSGLTDGVPNTANKSRITNSDLIYIPHAITLKAKTGFRFYIAIMTSGGQHISTLPSFVTEYKLKANTYFRILIARTSENASELANYIEFVNSIEFTSIEDEKISEVKQISMMGKTNPILTSDDIKIGKFIYAASDGAEGSSATYVCTDYVEIPQSIIRQVLFNSTLNSGAGFAFYTINKAYISGVSGATASANGYNIGTEYRTAPIPANAKYIRASMFAADYNDSNDFDFSFFSPSNIMANDASALSADDFEYGALGVNDRVVVPATSNGNRVVTKYIKVAKGDRVTTSSDCKIVVVEYDNNFVYKASSSPWVTSYIIANDGYVRIQCQTGSRNFAATKISITTNGQQFNGNLADKQIVTEIVNTLIKGSRFGQISQLAISGNSFIGYPHFITVGHRGCMLGVPENTIPAFVQARKNGLYVFETDVQFTSDNVPVMLHDYTVDRTSDGSGTLSSMTYAEVYALDFGSWVSSDFAGTKIPTLEETFSLARALGMDMILEWKQPDGGFTNDQINIIFNLVKKYNMNKHLTWSGLLPSQWSIVLSEFPDATILLSNLAGITSAFIDEADSIKTAQNTIILSTDISNLDDAGIELAIEAEYPINVAFVNTDVLMDSVPPYVTWVTTDGVNMNDYLYRKAFGLS